MRRINLRRVQTAPLVLLLALIPACGTTSVATNCQVQPRTALAIKVYGDEMNVINQGPASVEFRPAQAEAGPAPVGPARSLALVVSHLTKCFQIQGLSRSVK